MNSTFNNTNKLLFDASVEINGSINLLVEKEGKILFNKHIGNSINFNGTTNAADNETIYDLASNTKIYAGGLAIQHILSNDKYKVKLTTKLNEIFSDGFWNRKTQKIDNSTTWMHSDISSKNYTYKDIKNVNQSHRQDITLKNIIEHTSGFGSEVFAFSKALFEQDQKTMQNGELDGVKISFEEICSNSPESTVYKIINNYPIINIPGKEYLYSDINYMLLTSVIETIAEMDFDKFVYLIFKKIGAKLYFQKDIPAKNVAATEFNGSERTNFFEKSNKIRKGVIIGQVNDEKSYYLMNGISAHAGLFANKMEMMKVLNVLECGLTADGKMIISKDIINSFRIDCSLNSCQSLCYFKKGLNPTVSRNELFGSKPSINSFGHSGWVGILSMIDPINKIKVIILTNKKHSKFMSVNDNTCEDDYSPYTKYSTYIDSIYKDLELV